MTAVFKATSVIALIGLALFANQWLLNHLNEHQLDIARKVGFSFVAWGLLVVAFRSIEDNGEVRRCAELPDAP